MFFSFSLVDSLPHCCTGISVIHSPPTGTTTAETGAVETNISSSTNNVALAAATTTLNIAAAINTSTSTAIALGSGTGVGGGGARSPTTTPTRSSLPSIPIPIFKGDFELEGRNTGARTSLASTISAASSSTTDHPEAPLLIFTEDGDGVSVSTPGSTTTTTSSFHFLLDPAQGEVSECTRIVSLHSFLELTNYNNNTKNDFSASKYYKCTL